MRLAHFSDVHVTDSPLGWGRAALVPKRLAGALSYYAGGRRQRFKGAAERIRQMLLDIDSQRVDHALCSGDLTATSIAPEFAEAARLLAGREHTTIIPGNHDRYVADARRRFEEYFGERQYPFMQSIGEQAVVVCLDTARPTSLTDSSGLCGEAQRDRLRAMLSAPVVAGKFVIVMLHYGVLRPDGSRDKPSHGLRDDREVLALLDDPALKIDLVLHGHMHKAYTVRSERRRIICAGSATDLHVACGYNVYDIDPEARQLIVERRKFTPAGYQLASCETLDL
jgi:3',5'-cyclic AMP phosphodiesterase CpdA